MREIIHLLMQHPYLLILLLLWVFSGVLNAAAKARREQQQRQQRQPGADPAAELARRRAEVRRAERTAPPDVHRPQTAEDIARQLREMLGLETEPAPPRPPLRDEMEADRPRHPEPEEGDRVGASVAGKLGELHEAIAARRQKATAVAASVGQHLGHAPTAAALAPHVRVATSPLSFDPRRAAAAIVALEVFGPPRSLRPYDTSWP